MAHMYLGLRLILLLFSCYGYIRYLEKYLQIEFTIGVLFSSLCSIMFFSGILNIMKETAWCLCIVGVALAIQSVIRKESIYSLLCPGIVFFAVSSVILLIALHEMVFTDYDDFSHWGTVVKVIYTQNRFPNYSDSIITFQSYPTGSASFLYYFLTISGISSEWFQLYVQAIFTVGLLISLFAWGKELLGKIASAAMVLGLMLCCTGPINLLVDTLLPSVAISGLCICFFYKDVLSQKIFWTTPFLISLVAIKNSGILLAILLLLFALLYMKKSELGKWAIASITPLATLLLWQKHVLLVFDNGLNARHSMSAESITSNFLNKEMIEVAEIISVYLKQIFSLGNPALYLLGLLAILVILSIVLKCRCKQSVAILSAFSIGCYLIYGIGMLGMYISTMPYVEAVRLAGFSRYHKTILIFCCAFAYLAAVEISSEKYSISAAAWVLTILLSFYAMFPGLWYNNPKYCGFIRIDFEKLVAESDVLPEKRYCIVLDSSRKQYSGYLKYTAQFLLNSPNVLIVDINRYEERDNGWAGYDYLICFGESSEMESFLLKEFGSVQHRVFSEK